MPIELSPEELLIRLKKASIRDKKGIEDIIIPCSTKIKNIRKVPPEKNGQWNSWADLPQELFSKLLEERNVNVRMHPYRHSQPPKPRTDLDYFSAIKEIEDTRWDTHEQTVKELIRWATTRLREQAPFPSARVKRDYQKWSYVLLEIFRNLIYDRR